MVRRVVLVVLVAACGFRGGNTELDDDAPTGPAATISIVIEAEAFSNTTGPGGHYWTSITNEPGYSGMSYMQSIPPGSNCLVATEAPLCAPSLVYELTIPQLDTYFFHARMLAHNGFEDSIWYGLDGVVDPKPLTVTNDGLWHWRTGNSASLAAGGHTLRVWQREIGARVDVVAVTNGAPPP